MTTPNSIPLSTCYCCGIACEDAVSLKKYGAGYVNVCKKCDLKIWKEFFKKSNHPGDHSLDSKDSRAWAKDWNGIQNLKKKHESTILESVTDRKPSDQETTNAMAGIASQ